MQENFLIGIGGTGARVLEAFTHCCAAGFGPKGKVHVMIIDPDSGNGNLTRTKVLIQKYRTLREKFKGKEESNSAFQTNIVIPEGDAPFIWSIFDKADQTLAKYIGYENLKASAQDKPLADVADLLFTQLELETALNEGFRGHPSIGAVVMANPPMHEYPFKMLKEGMPNEAASARVFLVGSIFGGTGAAGFPTLGADKVIKFNPELQAALGEDKSKVLLGGALVLPYFNFKVDNTKDEKMFVTPQDFPVATKAALHYYNDKQLAFDQYYFIGDSLSQDVGTFSTGTATQENRPHYIELASALAAFDFFGQKVQANSGTEKSYFIASRETAIVNWDQLPLTRYSEELASKRIQFRESVSEFTLFCYTYLTVGQKFLAQSYSEARLNPWFKDSFSTYKEDSASDNPSHGSNKELHDLMGSYAQLFIKWITDLDDREHVRLIDREMLLESGVANQNEDGKSNLLLKDPETYPVNLGRLLKDQKLGKDYPYYINCLNRSYIKDNAQLAAHKYLNIFFKAARTFSKENAALLK